MELDILEQSKNFLRAYSNGKECRNETLHSWRRNWEYTVLHSLRVYSLAVQILETEKYRLSDDDILLIKVSAILHDIGKCETEQNHAEKSAEIVSKWLIQNPSITFKIHNTDRLLAIIRNHSDKDRHEEDLCSSILKDADILDEIGALSIFMASNHIDRNSPYFFNELLNRLQAYELNFCNVQMNRLNTQCGKAILHDKIKFIKQFVHELSLEINGTEELYEKYQTN